MKPETLVKIINILLIVTVVGTPLFYLKNSVYPYIFSKTLFFQAMVEILFFFWLALMIYKKEYRPRPSPLLLTLGGFLVILFLTSLLGIDPFRSFWSTQERMVGVFTFLHFTALTLVLASLGKEVGWKRLFYASLGTAAFVTILGFIQIKNPNLLLNEPVGTRPGSTFGNPTFLAGYLVFHVFLALYFLIKNREETVRAGKKGGVLEILFLSTSLVLSFAGVFLTQTRGDILGLGVGLAALIVFFAVKPPRIGFRLLTQRTVYVTLIGIVLVGGSFFAITKNASVWNKIPVINRFQDVSLQSAGLQPRLHALKVAWRGFLDKPVLGWGWDNFNIVFNKYYSPKLLELNYQETRFDKPHNVFLELLVVGGAPLLLAYLAIFGCFIYELKRTRDRTLYYVMAGAIGAYLVRSIFIFDTIGPLLVMFLIFGLGDAKYREGINRTSEIREGKAVVAMVRKKVTSASLEWTTSLALFLAIFPVYFINIQSMRATDHQFWGFTYFVKNKPAMAIDNFHQTLAVWSPYSWNFKRDYAAAAAENHFYNPASISENEVRGAILGMEEVVREHPEDAYNHYALVDLYNEVSDIDLKTFLPLAEKEAAMALKLSPDRQQVYFSLAKTKHLEGKRDEAIALVKQGLALNDQVPDAHFYYGLLSFDDGDNKTGYAEVKKAIELGRQWKNYNEPRVVAGFFADAGHLQEAIELYKKALEMNGDDLEARLKLGIGYYFDGQKELAKEQILKVMAGFDLTKSESYQNFEPILRNLGLVK